MNVLVLFWFPVFFNAALGNNDALGSDSIGEARLFTRFTGVSTSIASVLTNRAVEALTRSSSWWRKAWDARFSQWEERIGGRDWFLSVSLMVGFLWRAGRSAILGCVDRVNTNKYVYIFFWYCTDIPRLISNMFSHQSRGLSHGSGLQKCEAWAVGHRKPCGGFVELGLTRLGLGWPAAFRLGRHITNLVLT